MLGNLTTSQPGFTQAIAGGLFSLDNAIGSSGSNDISFTIDPFDTVGSHAITGLDHSSDFAGVFADDHVANAISTNNLITILPSL